jgi:hypothetical protein
LELAAQAEKKLILFLLSSKFFARKIRPFLGELVVRARSQGVFGKLAETSLAHVSEIATTIHVRAADGW